MGKNITLNSFLKKPRYPDGRERTAWACCMIGGNWVYNWYTAEQLKEFKKDNAVFGDTVEVQ